MEVLHANFCENRMTHVGVAMCDGHAVSMSQNGGRHPALQQQQQQPQQSQGEDGPMAALARCGALAAAGNGCTMASKSIQHPPARVATGRPSAPPPPPQPRHHRWMISAIVWHAAWLASDGPVKHVFAECRAVLCCQNGIEYRRRY